MRSRIYEEREKRKNEGMMRAGFIKIYREKFISASLYYNDVINGSGFFCYSCIRGRLGSGNSWWNDFVGCVIKLGYYKFRARSGNGNLFYIAFMTD